MGIDVSTVAAPPPRAAIAAAGPETASFDERWAAWQAKGVAHDGAVRRKMAVAVPILLVVAAVVIYLLRGV
jgi:hypothetical protein